MDYDERFWPGVAWLLSLEPSCKEAVALTIGWLWMWRRKEWNNTCCLNQRNLYVTVDDATIDKYLALDPHYPDFEEIPWEKSLNFKPQVGNDYDFIASPTKTREVVMHTKNHKKSITMSVAKVKRLKKNRVAIYFGAVIERNGHHVSELKDYRLTTATACIEWEKENEETTKNPTQP